MNEPSFDLRCRQLLAMERWYEGDTGSTLLQCQQQLASQLLTQSFGYYCLQIGVAQSVDLLHSARIQNKYRLHPKLASRDGVLGDFQQLPFATGSIDTVVLHHAHEFTDSPQAVLREVERVMVTGGHLLVFGFNPWSIAGCFWRLQGLRDGSPWRQKQWLNYPRMVDWLALLGFRLKQHRFAGYQLPQFIRHRVNPEADHWQTLSAQLPFGAIYAISAVKQPLAAIPPKPYRGYTSAALGGLAPVKPRVGANAHPSHKGSSSEGC